MYKKKETAGYKHFDFLVLDWICFVVTFLISLTVRFQDNAFLAMCTNEKWFRPYMRIVVLITCLHVVTVLMIEPYKGVLKCGGVSVCREVFRYVLENGYVWLDLCEPDYYVCVSFCV